MVRDSAPHPLLSNNDTVAFLREHERTLRVSGVGDCVGGVLLWNHLEGLVMACLPFVGCTRAD